MVKPSADKKSEKPTRGPPAPSDRRRGRPVGRHRVPLTIEERRARNALYEQERRDHVANAFSELAESLAVDPNITHAELLARSLTFIKERRREKPVSDFERQNANLAWQIQKLTEELVPLQPVPVPEAGDQGETAERDAANKLEEIVNSL